MCGIYGRLNLDRKPVTQNEIVRMSQSLAHRGPDDAHFFISNSFGFGANRLAIIDLQGGRQPLSSEDGNIWAVQNGEIYNYEEIARELKKRGHKLKTHSDTEVFIHLYEEEGLHFIQRLRGMFALALWDKTRKRLILARDRLGIKPLYYVVQDECILFASEIKGLLTQGIKRSIHLQALHDYLSLNYIPGPETIFEGITKLPPGYLFVAENDKVTTKPYWQLQDYLPLTRQRYSEREVLQSMRQKIDEAVRYHLVSDVPLGAFLSGGLDSSIIVALASKHYKGTLRTFSVGFKESSYDELSHARTIAKLFHTNHEELTLTLDIESLVEDMARFWDEPFADSSAIPTYAIARAARKYVKVILSGDGGDEVFGGYEFYKADQVLRLYRHAPRVVHRLLSAFFRQFLPVSFSKMSFDFKLKRFIRGSSYDYIKAHYLWRAIFTEQEKSLLYKQERSVEQTERIFEKMLVNLDTKDKLNELLYLDTRISLVDDMLTKVDRMSMANSLEVRLPFLDHTLVEYMQGLPSELKIHGFTLKYALKKAFRDILPPEIITRPKSGFHAPMPYWIKNDLQKMIYGYLSAKKLKSYGDYFNSEYVAKLLREHATGKVDWSRNIWGIFMFQLWYEHYMR